MPLIHSKRPKAFKENIRTEMHAGKPQKQSVAIAYSVKREAEKKHHKAEGGEMCAHGGKAKCNEGCYADGGDVAQQKLMNTGTYAPYSNEELDKEFSTGTLKRGINVPVVPSDETYAEGGAVDSWTKREDNEKGVHQSRSAGNPGVSYAGQRLRTSNQYGSDMESSKDLAASDSKSIHKKVLGEMQSMPKPNLMAEGGEVHEDAEQDHELIDSEIHNMMGEELMSAIDNKDKKRIMESLEAIVLQCMNKE